MVNKINFNPIYFTDIRFSNIENVRLFNEDFDSLLQVGHTKDNKIICFSTIEIYDFSYYSKPLTRKLYLNNIEYFRNIGFGQYIEKTIKKPNSRIPFFVYKTNIEILCSFEIPNFEVNFNDAVQFVIDNSLKYIIKLNNVAGNNYFDITSDELLRLIKLT